MVKAAIDVTSVVDNYVEALTRELDIQLLILSDVLTAGVDGQPTEIRFVVISSSFQEMNHQRRVEKLANIGLEVSPLIQAWPYTPSELEDLYRGKEA